MKGELTNDNHKDLEQALDYVVMNWCDDNHISGELAWLVIQSVATAKLKVFGNSPL